MDTMFLVLKVVLGVLVATAVIVCVLLIVKSQKGTSVKKSKSCHDIVTNRYKTKEELLPIDGIYNGMIISNSGKRFSAGIRCYGFDYFNSEAVVRNNTIQQYAGMLCSISSQTSLNATYHSFDISKQIAKHEAARMEIAKERDAARKVYEDYVDYLSSLPLADVEQYYEQAARLENNLHSLDSQCAHMDSIISYLQGFTSAHQQQFQDYSYFVSYDSPDEDLNEDAETILDNARRDLDLQIYNIRSRLSGMGVTCSAFNNEDLRVVCYRHCHPSGRNLSDEDIVRMLSKTRTIARKGKGL